MSWKRLGRLFVSERQHPWMVSHAANPFPFPLDGQRIGVLFNVRDAENRAQVAWLSFDPESPARTLELFDKPLMTAGEWGAFDESGVSIGNCIQDGEGRWRLYYLGWTLGGRTAFYNSIGLAYGESLTKGFRRASRAPVFGRCPLEPFSLSYPWVFQTNDGHWRMLYGATTNWLDRTTMRIELHEAVSADGIAWTPTGKAVLPLLEEEVAHSRPCLIYSGDRYELWFSVKTAKGYHIGYASSLDGQHWQRADAMRGLFPGEAEWESREVCYPAIFDFRGERFLFYCGNRYGETGFGWAQWTTCR